MNFSNNNRVGSLPLPPFGKILLAYQDEKIQLVNPIYIFVGQESKEAAYFHKQHGELCTYLPYGHDYRQYRWPIFDQTVIVECLGLMPVNFLKKMIADLFSTYYPRQIMYHSPSMSSENIDELIILRRDKKTDMTMSHDSMEAKHYAKR